jgi:hypothetical protein
MTFVLHTRAWLFPLGASDGKGDKQTVYGLLQAAGFHPHTSDGKTESLIMAVERNRRPFYVMVNFSSEGSSCSGTSPETSPKHLFPNPIPVLPPGIFPIN